MQLNGSGVDTGLHTLVDLLLLRAQQPDCAGYTFLHDGEAGATHLSYAELDRRARQVGAALQRLSAPGDRILLLYPPGLDYITAFFGCLYAGCIAVPAYPPQMKRLERTLPRLLAIIRQSQPVAALTTEPIRVQAALFTAAAPEFQGLRWLSIDTIPTEPPADWLAPPLDGSSIAFLQYTSGSTADPKGVLVSHANLLHNQEVIARAFDHTPQSSVAGWLPLYHDMGLIGNVLQPLYIGMPCVLMSPVAFLQSPIRWLRAISEYRATTSGGPNFAYDLCVRRTTPDQRAGLDLSCWTVAFNGAEPLRPETLERFTAAFAPYGFRHETWFPCYGLAESTLFVTGAGASTPPLIQPVETAALEQHQMIAAADGQPGSTALVSSGRAWLDQQIVVVDPHTRCRCRPDQIGEIWLAGPSTAHGYWAQPEETAQTFQAYLADTGGGPFLRTGDLGVVRGGEVFVTGRLKDLIIVRGRNHYPHDIELTAERCHPALRPGCGAAFTVELDGAERLVIVQELEREQRTCDADAVMSGIRAAVADQHELQVYAVVLIQPGSIFKTSSGKLQRHACRDAFLHDRLAEIGRSMLAEAPVEQLAEDGAAFVDRASLLVTAPDERPALLERFLQAQVAGVLSLAIEQVGIRKPFSSFGLDSLNAVELQHRIERALGVAPPIGSLLQETSIAELAAQLLDAAIEPPAPADAFLPAQEQAGQRLSYGQFALWLVQRMAPDSGAYNIAAAARLLGKIDIPILRQCFQVLLDRHTALRTTFAEHEGTPVRRVIEHAAFSFNLVDAAGWSPALLEQHMADQARRPFDLEREPLLRLNLYACAYQEHVLLITLHHIAADFWSLAVLTGELSTLYTRRLRDGSAALPPALQYDTFVSWQHALLAGPTGERLWSYWQQQLAGELPVLHLPADHPRAPVQSFRGALSIRTLPVELTRRLRALSQRCGATLYTTLLAAFEVLLYRYSGQTDLLIGSPVAGRSRAELAPLVGYCANPVVLRGDLSGNPGFLALLEQTRRTVLGALEHQDFPFPLLVERLQPRRDLSRSPLFQVMFIMQMSHVLDRAELAAFALGVPDVRMHLGDLVCESLALDQQIAQFDLTLRVAEVGQQLAATLEYNTALFEPGTATQMLDAFEVLLQEIVAQPEQTVADLSAAISPSPLPIAIAATFTAEPLEESLRFWMDQLRATYALHFAPYNQVFQQLLDPASLLATNQGTNILLVRLEDWGAPTPNAPAQAAKIEQHTHTFLSALEAAAMRMAGRTIICLCPASPAASADPALRATIERMEQLIAERIPLINDGQMIILQASDCAQRYRAGNLHDPGADAAGQIPYTPELFTAIGTALARMLFALYHPPAKVIVVDCDMTLWQGRCGEDHPHQLVLDPGNAALQHFLVAQANAGMLVCLCSKNNPADVLEVFAQRPDFPLRQEQLVAWRINWLPKSENLRSLAQELQVGLDSLIFLDDDPVECAEVRARCPEVLALRLPPDPAQVPLFLEQIWAFDHPTITREDAQRTQLYQQSRLREQAQATYSNLETFLESLELHIQVAPLEPAQIERAAQLTQRTNQFNTTTIRRSSGELRQLLGERTTVQVIRVADRFGDYGLVGLLVAEIGADLLVDTMLLSCRALGKHVEDTALVRLAQLAREHGCRRLVLRYSPTAKNAPVRAFLQRAGLDLEQLPDGSFHSGAAVDVLLAHPGLIQTGYGYSFSMAQAEETPTREGAAPSSGAPVPHWTMARFPGAANVMQRVAPELPTAAEIQARIAASRQRARPALEVAYVAPRSEIEQLIATAWCSVLHVDAPGVHDNFFDLGGHSVLLVRVRSQLCKALERDIPLVDMFRYPTITALAAYLDQGRPDQALLPSALVEQRARSGKSRLQLQREQQRRSAGVERGRE